MIAKALIGAAFALALAIPAASAQGKADKADQKFLTEAIQGNYAEVEMGKLAQQKGQSEAVKSFGQMLVTDHSAANEKAIAAAKQMGVTPPSGPSDKQKADHDKMAKMSGADFDRSFARDMAASGIVVLTPQGQVSQYLLGIDYPPRQVRLALVAASQERIGTVMDRLLLFCYHYDPTQGRYTPKVMMVVRAGGALTVLGMVLMVGMLVNGERKRGKAA